MSISSSHYLANDYEPVSMTISIKALMFSSTNWSTHQTVLLSVVDDEDAYNGTITISLEISDATTQAFAKAYATASIFVIDDDNASITLSSTNTIGVMETSLVGIATNTIILEGTSDSFLVRLNAKPYENVTVEVNFENATYASMTLKG